MKIYTTELIGTFFLTLVVALSGGSDLAPIAIGAILMIMIYAGGYISGAHYNPAVTTAVALSRSLGKGSVRSYWIAQVVGSMAALLVARGMNGVPFLPAPTGSILFAPFVAEVIFTMALCYVVLHTAVSKESKGNSYYGLAIGATLTIAAIVAGPISGAVLNPAIGVAAFIVGLMTGTHLALPALALYVIAPITGATLAAMLYGTQKSK